MNETPFKFTSEEKEQTLQILERLRTAVGDTFKPGDEQHLREDIQHAFINHQIKRNVFGMNPILAALQTAEIPASAFFAQVSTALFVSFIQCFLYFDLLY